MQQAVKFAAYLLILMVAMHFWRGAVPIQIIIVVGILAAIVLMWGIFESARGVRNERKVLASLEALGGNATLSELETHLFDSSAKFTQVQQLRDTIAYLTERKRIVEADDRLKIAK